MTDPGSTPPHATFVWSRWAAAYLALGVGAALGVVAVFFSPAWLGEYPQFQVDQVFGPWRVVWPAVASVIYLRTSLGLYARDARRLRLHWAAAVALPLLALWLVVVRELAWLGVAVAVVWWVTSFPLSLALWLRRKDFEPRAWGASPDLHPDAEAYLPLGWLGLILVCLLVDQLLVRLFSAVFAAIGLLLHLTVFSVRANQLWSAPPERVASGRGEIPFAWTDVVGPPLWLAASLGLSQDPGGVRWLVCGVSWWVGLGATLRGPLAYGVGLRLRLRTGWVGALALVGVCGLAAARDPRDRPQTPEERRVATTSFLRELQEAKALVDVERFDALWERAPSPELRVQTERVFAQDALRVFPLGRSTLTAPATLPGPAWVVDVSGNAGELWLPDRVHAERPSQVRCLIVELPGVVQVYDIGTWDCLGEVVGDPEVWARGLELE